MAEKSEPVFVKVASLRPDQSGLNLTVKVVDAKTVVDRPARGLSKAQKVVECTVGDETGTILFSARNEQAELAKPGSYITLRNARIDMFRGSMRLAVNQFGKIEAASGVKFAPKADNNMSLVEYELVPVPASAAAPAAQEGDEAAPAEGEEAAAAAEEAVAEPAAAAAAEEAAAEGEGEEEAGFEAAAAPV